MKMKFTRALGMLLAFALVFTLMPSFASREAFAEGENEKAWSASLTDFDLTPFNISYLNAFGYTDQGIYCSGNALAGKNILYSLPRRHLQAGQWGDPDRFQPRV